MTGAAFGLDRSLAIAGPATAQKTPDLARGFSRYTTGECTALYDGIREKKHDPASFSNATRRAPADAGLATAFVTIPITMFVVKLNGKLVLCDAGGDHQVQAFNPESVFVSGKVMANMRAAGIDRKKIETVLISHFHPDHIFGLREQKDTNAPVLPGWEVEKYAGVF